MKITNILSKLLDYLYYRKCYICSKKCTEISLCTDCLDNIFSNLTFNKAQKFSTNIYTGSTYEGNLLKIIRALKYHKKSEFAQIIADIIIKTIEHYDIDVENCIICPVPIHKNRFKKRKYNHMELVAEIVGRHFNITVENNLLERIKDTAPLYKLSISERKKTIENAFFVKQALNNKKIILLDDIITSGSTISELSKIIHNNNAKQLIVVCASKSRNCNF